MPIARFGRQARTALARIGPKAKIPTGLCAKMTAVVILGMCFIFVWSFFSSTPDTLNSQRESFSDITESLPTNSIRKGTPPTTTRHSPAQSSKHLNHQHPQQHHARSKKKPSLKKKDHGKFHGNASVALPSNEQDSKETGKEIVSDGKVEDGSERSESEVLVKGTEEGESEGEEGVGEDKEDGVEGEGGEGNEDSQGGDPDLEDRVDVKVAENEEDEMASDGTWGKKKQKGPLFDPKAQYKWKSCSTRSTHKYIPCIDIESPKGKIQSYRHHERICPRTPPMCLVPLPPDYGTPVPWPESKLKILHKNVAHLKLDAYIKTHSWLVESGEYIMFPQNQSNAVNDVAHFLESIEEMVPDIEWGKNVRIVLDIGVTDSSFVSALFDKDVLTLALGLKSDLVDLAQVAIERGFPAIVSPFATKRLPFPSGVFDAIHCSGCNIRWHSSGGKLLEMNRILRPGGYFILSAKHNSIEAEEAMTSLTASICWNVLADKTDEVTEVGVKIHQKPDSNSIYDLRRRKNPPLCNGNENPDAAWHVQIRHCLHPIPSAIEQHGNEWPAEWPKRLESYPDWLNDKEKVKADTEHWKAIVEKSYLTGIGIEWRNIRNVMDMKAIYGGFAAALSQQKIWVMNVVPVHAPNTLPYIYERGLFGVYHNWCESFGSYPRSYDLLHADHLFSRLKNRCNKPVAIVVEMDRLLRPGGWAIVRDKLIILDPLEGIFRSLNWEIRMTFSQDKEGILVAQKTTWRP